uniref:GHMP kinase N-terminal domain-containing protein n=1 Tax=Chromera velia CCMP2878 TaxID=1169474 RepID=A0A0G4I1X2_9ALVE|eukprot:Cvel_10215.t1-p1 / transcript=Cvel_10215.t1 / gene=Cvel_10215 / organism=Chromera_velia_CCMP2878 / gene_product=4-diphosphocytidyl-2-C-methyl-D-erythritol kinase,, putative / transcript_product=4-diphosphocytidyl-2-C-methyl-D-erythritol kinase,, putative / location=Cvel_scaffold611:53811-56144(+) / protein_length=374 / sequence_SO=supercontig / SO=protein_coding / is_pseudo=false
MPVSLVFLAFGLATAVTASSNAPTQAPAFLSHLQRSTAACGVRGRARRRTTCRLAETEGETLTLFSPSKVNLFLRILRRRPDNYHDLASLFQTISLGDSLSFSALPTGASADVLTCTDSSVPTDGSNLVVKAFDLFRRKSGKNKFFRCHIDKKVPNQAGLGGGSGNAATALFAAARLTASGDGAVSQEDLLKWSADIGSDITFFLSGGTAYCTGRGEIVEPLAALPHAPPCLYVVKPDEGLSTPLVYKSLDLSALSPEDPDGLLRCFCAETADRWRLVNDLEPPALKNLPSLKTLKGEMGELYGVQEGKGLENTVMMSGSGTAVFSLGEPVGGKEAFKKFVADRPTLRAWRCTFVNRPGNSPEQWFEETTVEPL